MPTPNLHGGLMELNHIHREAFIRGWGPPGRESSFTPDSCRWAGVKAARPGGAGPQPREGLPIRL